MSSSVMLSQMYQHLCSPCIPIKMRTMFTTSSLTNWMSPIVPVSLWKVLSLLGLPVNSSVVLGKSLLRRCSEIWINGRSQGHFSLILHNVLKSHSSAQVLGSFSQCSSLEAMAGSPTTSPSYTTIGTHLLWRGAFACLDSCTPSPLAPRLGSAPGATGTYLPTPTSTAHPKHCFVCHQTPPPYGLHAQGVKSLSQQAGEQTQSTSERSFFFPPCENAGLR